MHFEYLTTEEEVRSLIAWHNENSEWVVLDTETTDKDPRVARLVDIQISGRRPDEAFAFSGEFLQCLGELRCLQVWHNFKYDWKVCLRHGLDLRGKPMRDTMLMHHLADENSPHSLDAWVQANYGDDYKERFWSRYESYTAAPADVRLDYGCRDIVYTGRFYRGLLESLSASRVPTSLVDHVHRLALSLFDTETVGIKVDLEYCISMGGELKLAIAGIEQELRRLGGSHCELIEMQQWLKEIEKRKTEKGRQNVPRPQFNFSSSAQVSALLYDELKLPAQIDARTKNRTSDDKALEKLESKHPIIPKIRQLRKYSKMYGSFVEGILERAIGDTVYPSFNINGTVTGRISHSEPNMGQMPSKGEWVKIRGIFVPSPGSQLITCDYGQLEVCIEAHFSHDANLLKIINEGASKHDITAEALGIPRSTAKTLNFAMQYRCGIPKVAELCSCSMDQAARIFQKYWETYSGVQRVYEECAAKVDRGEPIVNPFGRKRRFPTQFKSKWEKEAAYRQAYSSLIQGTGADLTSRAAYQVAEALKARQWGRLWFTVHDELLSEVQFRHVEAARELISRTMVLVGEEARLSVPLAVSCSDGLSRWQK